MDVLFFNLSFEILVGYRILDMSVWWLVDYFGVVGENFLGFINFFYLVLKFDIFIC